MIKHKLLMKSGGEAALRWGTGCSLKRLYVCSQIASSQAVETAFPIVSFLPPCPPPHSLSKHQHFQTERQSQQPRSRPRPFTSKLIETKRTIPEIFLSLRSEAFVPPPKLKRLLSSKNKFSPH